MTIAVTDLVLKAVAARKSSHGGEDDRATEGIPDSRALGRVGRSGDGHRSRIKVAIYVEIVGQHFNTQRRVDGRDAQVVPGIGREGIDITN